MGIYVELWDYPHQKARYLIEKHGAIPARVEEYALVRSDSLMLCVIDNGAFEAALVIVDKHEYERVNRPDPRKKQFLVMKKEEILKISASYRRYQEMLKRREGQG